MQKLWIKISSLLVVVLSLASQPFSYSADSTLLAHGINGYAPGSRYAASDMEKNFSYEGIAAKNFNLFPEDGNQVQKIGFAVFQEILNHIQTKNAFGVLKSNAFNYLLGAGMTSPDQDSLDKLNTQSIPLSLSLGPASGVPYSTVLSIGSMYPKLANTSTSEFVQEYVIKFPEMYKVKSYDKIFWNISNYLKSVKATVKPGNNMIYHKIPSLFIIYPTRFLDLTIDFTRFATNAKNQVTNPGIFLTISHKPIRVANDLCSTNGAPKATTLNHPIFRKQG